MPAMGDSVAEGTVLEWRKQEGDQVAVDETIVEISTDKVDAEVPAPVSGTLVKIRAAEGETIPVGAPLAEIATNGAGPTPTPNGAEASEPAADGVAAGAATTALPTAPTATVSPSAARIFTSRPVTGEGTSASTLSVEISTSVSSAATESPSCLCHSSTVPSATESPIAGMTTSTVPLLTAIYCIQL